MTPSTWNDTNQHWIPQFLLKGFGIAGKASYLYELDKRTGSIERRNVADAASKPHLLSELDDELVRKIEVVSSKAVARIRKGDLHIDKEDRQALDALTWVLYLNDPYEIDKETTRQAVIRGNKPGAC